MVLCEDGDHTDIVHLEPNGPVMPQSLFVLAPAKATFSCLLLLYYYNFLFSIFYSSQQR